jgi:hypothetical protein
MQAIAARPVTNQEQVLEVQVLDYFGRGVIASPGTDWRLCLVTDNGSSAGLTGTDPWRATMERPGAEAELRVVNIRDMSDPAAVAARDYLFSNRPA